MPGYKLVPMGNSHVPEGRHVLQEMSLLQNLKLDAYTKEIRMRSGRDHQSGI